MAMDLNKMIGYKFFREINENEIESLRLMKVYDINDVISLKMMNTKTEEIVILSEKDLSKYSALKPEGILIFSGVEIDNAQDVIVAAYLLDKIENRDLRPFCVCRQCITDIYYNLLIQDTSDMIVGMSMNITNIPQGFDYGTMLLADNVLFKYSYMI